MSLRLPEVIRRFTRKLLRNPQTVAPPYECRRACPQLIALEDRVVPTPLVDVSNLANAIEGTSNGIFRFERGIGGLSQPLTVYYTISGTATSGTDYAPLTGSVTFEPHDEIADVEIDVINYDDNIPEFDETITLTITADSAYTIGTDEATVTIHDNETPAVAVVAVNDAAEGGTNGKFSFVRMGNTSNSLTVSYSISGTATNGVDYPTLSGSVTFAPGSSTAVVEVDALHDGLVEAPTETVIATITSSANYTIGTPGAATVLSIDTDILPVAFDGLETTSVNTPVVVSVLDLATSLYGDTLTVTAVSQGSAGSVVLNGDSATYTPNTDFSGEDSFTYTVEDPFGNEATGTVTITVTRPLAPPTTVWTAEGVPVVVEVEELVFDPDGDSMTATAVTQGAHGTVVLNMDGTVTYTPNANYEGDDSFTYTVEDPDGNEATNTITVTVGDTDPVALDDDAATAVNTPVNLAVEDLAFDPAGDTVEVISVTQGAHGTVTVETDGSITYTPNTNYEGTDTFTYTIEDDDNNSSTGTITVTIGTPMPSDVDEIIADLEAIEEEIENYDVNSPPDLGSAISAITSSVYTIITDFTTFISTSNIDIVGANKSYNDLVTTVYNIKRKMYSRYYKMLDMEDALWNAAVTNKSQIASLNVQLKVEIAKPQPNAATISTLMFQILTLETLQVHLVGNWDDAHDAMQKAYKGAIALWQIWIANNMNMFGELGQGLFAPPVPPVRNQDDLRP